MSEPQPTQKPAAGLAYIRDQYCVPAAGLIHVEIRRRAAVIVGATAGNLLVRVRGDRTVVTAHPTRETRYLPADVDEIQVLTDVDAGLVYRVEQRSTQYAMCRRTWKRCTRIANICDEIGLTQLLPDGITAGTYALTDEGRATLAAHQQLVESGPFIPPTPEGSTGVS